jgi:carbamoyl-phosphate synthase small subunit
LEAVLALENGTLYRGQSAGAEGEARGEVVFNTSMTGYQEVLTDPSYAGQIVTMTCAEIGNYGVSPEDVESRKPQVAGFIIRDESPVASNWRAEGTLRDYLAANNVVAISDIDTRELTRLLRSSGVMRGVIATGAAADEASLVARARSIPQMEGSDLVTGVTSDTAFDWPQEDPDEFGVVPEHRARRRLAIAAYDYGMKWNIMRRLSAHGCDVRVFPAATPAKALLSGGPDGVFLSNGPGDPAALPYAIDNARTLVQSGVPVFGICLGHQILGLAMGGRTFKLKFGHRGANHPVKKLQTGKIEITSQNHGFAVEGPSGEPRIEADEPIRWETAFGAAELSHLNLYDRTVEGLVLQDVHGATVQYHPEAGPGPHDARYLFDRFLELASA